MILQEILRQKGTHVHTIGPQATIEEAVERLVEYNVGSLVVSQEDAEPKQVLGMITERDIMRVVAAHRGRLNELKVEEVMTRELITVEPTELTTRAMGLMTEHRIRHLPVIVDGQLCGMVSIGDIVKRHYELLQQENYFMKSYIRGEGAERGTP